MGTGMLEGKHVVITGAAGGLGSAVVEAFVAAGANCHLPMREGRREAAGREQRATVRVAAGIDLGKEAAVAAFYAECPPIWASIHLAGGYAASRLVETSLDDLRRQLDINLATAFLCSREAVRAMQAGSPTGGRIVNVTSRAAMVPGGGSIAYSVAKAAVSMLTLALAEETKGLGILVNAVAPSTIDTPANRAAMPRADPTLWPKPAEIAKVILWLASPENRLTSGAIIPVYGNA